MKNGAGSGGVPRRDGLSAPAGVPTVATISTRRRRAAAVGPNGLDAALTRPRGSGRSLSWDALRSELFDVAIIGGGINGACLYDELCARGQRVALIERGDIAGGTSQASGMLVWGGLLYLKSLDLRTVWKLSKSRDSMIRSVGGEVVPRRFRYVCSTEGRLSDLVVRAGLRLYWALGLARRAGPAVEADYPESALLRDGSNRRCYGFEEAVLELSDARFVLSWVTRHRGNGRVPLNHCAVHGGRYDRDRAVWSLDVVDRLSGDEASLRARRIVNCAGVWTDEVNRTCGIDSPYRHLPSRGVFVAVPRSPQHRAPLALDTGANGDVICLLPWGPVSLWGPTETLVDDVADAFRVDRGDLDFLFEQSERHLARPICPDDIVSIRCGVRPLVVRRGAGLPSRNTLAVSRRSIVVADRDRPWVSVYGGKITGCVELARRVAGLVAPGPRSIARPRPELPRRPPESALTTFPGLDGHVPDLDWCIENELCCTLSDYLRRRTNIAQWVRRGGFGESGENEGVLRALAHRLTGGDDFAARAAVEEYRREVERTLALLSRQARTRTEAFFHEHPGAPSAR